RRWGCWLQEAGRWQRQRRRKPYRQRRERKAHFGELVQMDGSFHSWLEECGPRGCLMQMVDDATTTALGWFSAEETIWAAAAILRCWIERYGSRTVRGQSAGDAVRPDVREAGHSHHCGQFAASQRCTAPIRTDW